MISRTIFCSAQASVMRLARTGPMPVTSRRRSGSASIDVEHLLAESLDQLFGIDRADAADHPGAEVFLDAVDRGRRRGAHEARFELLAMGVVVDPFARCRNPLAGGDVAAWPTTVTRSRWPRALTRRTQKPFSPLWKVTRSTRPASTSWVDGSCCGLICVATVGASPPNRIWRPALRSRSSSATRAPRVLSIGDRSLVRNRPAI